MRKILDRLYISLVFIFLYAPIVVLIIFSFNDSKSRSVWHGFTTKWYTELFSDKVIINSLYTTLTVATLSAVIATIIGTVAAVGIMNMRKKQRKVVLALNNIPVMNPDIITGVSLSLLFVSFGFVLTKFTGRAFEFGFTTLLLAHITFNIPYVILSVLPKLRSLDKNLYEAAVDLGAKPLYAFTKVVLPQISPGIITGLIMAFTLSIDDFAVSYFTAGAEVQTLSMVVYSMTKKRVTPSINALSTIMFVSVLILLLIINKRQSKDISVRR